MANDNGPGREIFISLTRDDHGTANALEKALPNLLGDSVSVQYSTSETLGGGIRSGANSFRWIVERVRLCDSALILITRTSAQEPWMLWEAGAVYGAASAVSAEVLEKVRTFLDQVQPEQVPSPIRESQTEFRRGDDGNQMAALLEEILLRYKSHMEDTRYLKAARRAFEEAPQIIDKLDERNIWIHATAANAAFFIGNTEKAKSHLSRLFEFGPSPEKIANRAGRDRIASSLKEAAIPVDELKAVLNQ